MRFRGLDNSRDKAKNELSILVIIFSLALLIRLVYLFESLKNPTFFVPIIDAGNYHRLAQEFARHGRLSEEFFWQPPLYPLFLGIIYALFGESIFVAKIIQALLGAMTCCLTYYLGHLTLGRREGIIASTLFTFFGPMIFYETELLGTGLAAFLCTFLLILLFLAKKKGKTISFLLGGCSALAILCRPTFIPFVGVIPVFLLLKKREKKKEEKNCLLLLSSWIAGFLIIILPFAALNSKLTKAKFSVLPFSGGINLYLGNNPNLCKTLTIRPGWDWQKLVDMPRRQGIKDVREQDRFFRKLVIEFIKRNPLEFLSGLLQKALRFLSSREIPRNEDIYLFRQWSYLLKVLVWKWGGFGFPFGVVLPLLFIGTFSRFKQIPSLLLLFILFNASAIILFFVSSRYRLESVPAMIVVASGGVSGLIENLKKKKWRFLVTALIVGTFSVAISTLPGPFCEEKIDYGAEMASILGNKHLEAGRIESAENWFRKALESKQNHCDACLGLGDVFFKKGNLKEACFYYKQASLFRPDNAQPYYKMGLALSFMGQPQEAADLFKESLSLNPLSGKVHVLLGEVLLKLGKAEEAFSHYEQALEVEIEQRDRARAHLQLGLLNWCKERMESTEHHLLQALRLNPDDPKVLLSLSWLRATSQDARFRNASQARDFALKALSMEKLTFQSHDTLGASLAEAGDFDGAAREAQKAIEFASSNPETRNFAKSISQRLKLYLQKKPFRANHPSEWLITWEEESEYANK